MLSLSSFRFSFGSIERFASIYAPAYSADLVKSVFAQNGQLIVPDGIIARATLIRENGGLSCTHNDFQRVEPAAIVRAEPSFDENAENVVAAVSYTHLGTQ